MNPLLVHFTSEEHKRRDRAAMRWFFAVLYGGVERPEEFRKWLNESDDNTPAFLRAVELWKVRRLPRIKALNRAVRRRQFRRDLILALLTLTIGALAGTIVTLSWLTWWLG